jgi:hypothetical protein
VAEAQWSAPSFTPPADWREEPGRVFEKLSTLAHSKSMLPTVTTNIPPGAPNAGPAGRLQVLATEHWSLLATRSLTYNEALSRVTIFLAILSGAVIARALVAQADSFGRTSISIAIPVLLIVLFTGIATVRRLVMLNSDDFRW